MVSGKLKSGLVAELSVRDHKWIAGLDAASGGSDEGPSPHEILESSLAACAILTSQLYANRKGFKLESTDVTVKIVEEGKETKIEVTIHFHGDLTEEQRQRLFEIAGRCPIHRLLESNIHIENKLV